ncbi:MAG: hypothetical protein GY913_14140 [Proteobacteria bacterium]|nr:hypothetical protein [Pseudomonadota bacterium]MCP4918049.1 hypothetical protein [Pseudomonadota bacterium]
MTTPAPEETSARFGTFTGVFTPTLLTILGVIMYVRMGWVVGNAGLGGAMLILGLGILITAATGLSLSSIATNTRIGAGGPYAIIKRSLGLEVGGSIGIPLYLTRPLGVAMYIFGLREGIQWVWPDIPPLPVDLVLLLVLFAIAFKSADLAFKLQYGIMAIIALSLVSIFASTAPFEGTHEIVLRGDYDGGKTDFWGVFAVFFPATTGILAGANMSGELDNPRRAIPLGTLSAIGLSSVIYFAVAVWVAYAAPVDELVSNYNVAIDRSWVRFLVLAGLLGATASSALAGLVGGPRILMAMGQSRILPASSWLAEVKGGEPRNAMIVTGVLTLGAIMVRDLNAIAPIVTMFFLITYCMINVVVLIEQGLGLVSYRPTLRIPVVVPLVGLVGSLFSMFIVSPAFSLVSVVMVIAIFAFIRRRQIEQGGTAEVRSAIFVAFAEWAAGKVTPEDLDNARAWKPHVLVPVDDPDVLRGSHKILHDLTRPEGTIKLLGLATEPQAIARIEAQLDVSSKALRDRGVLASWSMVALPGYVHGIGVGAMALQGAFFRPNLLFMSLPAAGPRRDEVHEVLAVAQDIEMGVLLYSPLPTVGLGRQQDVMLWVRHSGEQWSAEDAFAAGNLDLILLMGFRLSRVWGGRLSIATVAATSAEQGAALRFLTELADLARLPPRVDKRVMVGTFAEALANSQPPDLSIFGLSLPLPDLDRAQWLTETSRSSCLLVLDSGQESARA